MKDMIRLSNLGLLVYKNITRAALAEKLEIAYFYIEHYFKNINIPTLLSLARKTEVVFNDFYEWVDRINYYLKLTEDENATIFR